jgi:hypothetical protein
MQEDNSISLFKEILRGGSTTMTTTGNKTKRSARGLRIFEFVALHHFIPEVI